MNVQQIIEQINQIRENVELLKRQDLEVLTKYSEKVEQLKSNRLESISEYKSKQIQTAKTNYDGMIYGIESDYENSLNKIHDHIQKFIIFKKKELSKDFPEASAYFNSQSNNVPFFQQINDVSQLNELDNGIYDEQTQYRVFLNQGHFIPQEELDQMYSEKISKKEVYRVENGVLFKADSPYLKVGSQISLFLEDSFTYHGYITQIQSILTLNISGADFKLPVSALNLGLATLVPN